jgi:hypothetical protein
MAYLWGAMRRRDKQRTPQGAEIPVPARKAVFDDLRKVAKADKPGSDASESGSDEQESE